MPSPRRWRPRRRRCMPGAGGKVLKLGTIDAVRRCASPQTRPRTAVGGVFKAGGSPDVRSWRRLRWRRRRRCWHLPLQARPAHRRRMQAAAPPSRQCLSVSAAISPLPRLSPRRGRRCHPSCSPHARCSPWRPPSSPPTPRRCPPPSPTASTSSWSPYLATCPPRLASPPPCARSPTPSP